MLRFVLCLAALSASTARVVDNESPPQWGLKYSVKGVFYQPLKDIQIPFEAWFDFQNHKERTDVYDGIASVYTHLPSKAQAGLIRKVFHYTSETELNKVTCEDYSLPEEKHEIDSLLPDMSHYKFMGTEIRASKWQLVKTKNDGIIRQEYTLWIKYGEDDQPIPLKFEKNEYNTVRGIHSDNSYYEFTAYRTEAIDDSIFEIGQGLPFPYDLTKLQELKHQLPDQFDWRLHGAVTPVKDQASCGSCWAFAAVGAVEGAVFIHGRSGRLTRLSEQALVDCSWGEHNAVYPNIGNMGCGGGNAVSAFDWVKKHGLPTFEEYGGYLAENGLCHIENVTRTTFIKDWSHVQPRDEHALRLAIFKHGPVAVSFLSNTKSFRFYSSGVYTDQNQECPPGDLDHLVLAVGYGELDGERYLLIKNSWGPQWGINGYFLISTRHNTCGIMDHPFFVVV